MQRKHEEVKNLNSLNVAFSSLSFSARIESFQIRMDSVYALNGAQSNLVINFVIRIDG